MSRPRRERRSGVYAICCKFTGYRYIGGASDLDARWATHLRRLREGDSHNKALQYAFDAFGEDNLYFVVLLQCHVSELDVCEQQAIAGSEWPLFNLLKGVRNPRGKMTPEARAALSARAKRQHAEGKLGRQTWRNQ